MNYPREIGVSIATEQDPVIQLARAACTLELEAANLGNSPLEQESCRRRAERLRALQFETFLDDPIPAHPLALKEVLTITEATEQEICDHTDAVAWGWASNALDEEHRRLQITEMRGQRQRAIGKGFLIVLVFAVGMLCLIVHYAPNIDTWRLPWN